MMVSWLLLAVAIVLEVLGTTSMKLSEGFARPMYALLMVVFYTLSFVALALVLKRIDVSVAYAVWSGLGMALVAALGVLAFGEPLTAVKVLGLALIMAGVAVLNLAGAH